MDKVAGKMLVIIRSKSIGKPRNETEKDSIKKQAAFHRNKNITDLHKYFRVDSLKKHSVNKIFVSTHLQIVALLQRSIPTFSLDFLDQPTNVNAGSCRHSTKCHAHNPGLQIRIFGSLFAPKPLRYQTQFSPEWRRIVRW